MSIFLGLEPYQGGRMTNPGEPLSRIFIPAVSTRVSRVNGQGGTLSMLNIEQVPAVQSNIRQISEQERAIGISLDVGIPSTPSQEGPQTQEIGRQLPKSYQEVQGVLNLITPSRAGKKTNAYSLKELQQIARSLNLASTGTKEVLANRILDAVRSYHQLA